MTAELAILLAVVVIALVAVAVDRAACASAWRQIAMERRWDDERRVHDDT